MPVVAIMVIVVSLMFTVFMIIWAVRRSQSTSMESQRLLTDRDLLLLMNAEPDRIISPAELAKRSGMPLNQARSRLHRLMYDGLVNQMNSGLKYFYELKKPITKDSILQLSDKPFISLDDLFELFEYYEHKMNLQDICIATGLPFKVIKEEMKFFQKEGVVHQMTQHNGMGLVANKFYVLQDAYKGSRKDFESEDAEMNLELEKIYDRIKKDGDEFV